jgi:hypothetical protein
MVQRVASVVGVLALAAVLVVLGDPRPALASGDDLARLYRNVPAAAVYDAADNWIALPASSALRPAPPSPTSPGPILRPNDKPGPQPVGKTGKALGAAALALVAADMGYGIGNFALDFVWSDRPRLGDEYVGPLPNFDQSAQQATTNTTVTARWYNGTSYLNGPATWSLVSGPIPGAPGTGAALTVTARLTGTPPASGYSSTFNNSHGYSVRCRKADGTFVGSYGVTFATLQASNSWTSTASVSGPCAPDQTYAYFFAAGGVLGETAMQYTPAAPAGSPVRTYVPKRECVKQSDPSVVQVIDGAPQTLTHEQTPGTFVFPACPDGFLANGHAVTEQTGAAAPVPVYGVGTGMQSTLQTYPQCQTQVCVAELVRVLPDGQTVAYSAEAVASGLFASFPEAVARGSSPEYVCRFGGQVVALAECRHFPVAAPAPTPTSTDDARCDLNFSWNPVSWVLEPVKCALSWAFVPRQSHVDAQVAQVRGAWTGTGPANYLDAAGGVVTAVGGIGAGAGGCQGPALSWAGSGVFPGFTVYPLNGCPGTVLGDRIAPVFRVLVLIGLYVGGAWVAARIVASSMGLQLPAWRGEKEGAA